MNLSEKLIKNISNALNENVFTDHNISNKTHIKTKRESLCCNDYLLIDTRDLPEYEDYVEYCEANDITPDSRSSLAYYDYAIESNRRDYLDMMEEIENNNEAQYPVLVEYRKRGIDYLYYSQNLYVAIISIKKRLNPWDFRIEMVNGHIVYTSIDHDGRITVNMYKATNQGMNEYDEIVSSQGDNALPQNIPSHWIENYKEPLYM